MTETEVAFAPTPVGARRRRLPPIAAGAVIVTLLGLAVVKPWGSAPGPAPSPAASGAPASGASSTTSPSSAQPGSPLAGSSLADGTLAGTLQIPPHPAAWGISIGRSDGGDPAGGPPTWTAWVPLDSVWWRSASSLRGLGPTGTDCASTPTLQATPSIVGITVPDATSTDFRVVGWHSSGKLTEPLDGDLVRLDTPGSGQVAELARADGLTWPDGGYELNLLMPDGVTTLAFCLASPAPASATTGLDPTIVAKIVAQLVRRSGAWGVGAGGNGPRLVLDEPWTDWVAADPGPAWNGSSLTLWPATGLCMSVPTLPSHASLVAITVPPGLVPDWHVVAWWQDGSGIASLGGVVRQISPPGNREISYLERVDRGPWPAGRYEFDIRAGDHETSLTACIGGH